MQILVIDGYADAATTLRDVLEFLGHEVCLATSGPQGIEAARRDHPDVVICDLALTDMNGLQVCQALRASPAQMTRLICWTGLLTPECRSCAEAHGF